MRLPEVDRLKGLAILGVLLIHARPFEHTAFGDLVVNRSVPVFLVLFGLTSELWWRRRAEAPFGTMLGAWIVSRFQRLVVPLWGMLLLWLLASLLLDPASPVSPRVVVAMVGGYLTWIPTGWFVTLVLQLVALVPVLRWLVARLSMPIALGLAALAVISSLRNVFPIIAFMRTLLLDHSVRAGEHLFFYFSIFPGVHLFGVVAGMALAPRPPALRSATGRAALAGLVLGWLLLSGLDGLSRLAVIDFLDPALTIVLLGLVAHPPATHPLARALAWLGVHSWGLYLGQTLTYAVCEMIGWRPWTAALPERWFSFGVLLASALVLTLVGNAIRARLPIRFVGSA